MLQTKFVEKIKKYILCSIFFFSENRAVYKIIWKNITEAGRPHEDIKRHKPFACWVNTAIDTRS